MTHKTSKKPEVKRREKTFQTDNILMFYLHQGIDGKAPNSDNMNEGFPSRGDRFHGGCLSFHRN